MFLLGGPQAHPVGPALAAPVGSPGLARPDVPPALAEFVASPEPGLSPRTVTTPDGRTAHLIDLGAPNGHELLDRIAAELPSASSAVTDFWGAHWPSAVTIVIAGSDEQFAALAGGTPDVAATTTAQRITFSAGATAMNDTDLRTVLRHELFHYAARDDTAADAPIWLTEGTADFVGRPAMPASLAVPIDAALPTDAELGTAGPNRLAAYDRAWSFASYVADRYGAAALRELYLTVGGHGHGDTAGGVRDALGVELAEVLTGWRQWRPS